MKNPDNHQIPVFIGLATGLVFAPLAYGGTTGWFTSMFAVYIGGIALIWAMTAKVGTAPHAANIRYILLPAALVSIAILWCFAQAWVSAPPGIAHHTWSEASEILSNPSGRTLGPAISVNPQESAAGAVRLTGYSLVFLLCYLIAGIERRAARLLSIVVLAGTAYALYGIGLQLSGSGYVLWYERNFEPGNLSSTFPNRNAFADYAALCLLSGLALMYRVRLRYEDTSSGFLQAVTAVSAYYLRRSGWAIYAAVILFTAILMTHSRGGLIVTVISVAVFAVCATRNARNRKFAVISLAMFTIGASVLIGLAGSGTVERFAKIDSASVERFEIFRLTVEAIWNRPLLGTGLGTFSDIFAAYRTEMLRPRIDFAHNSFLENALEMGMPAAIAFYAGLTALFILFVRSLRQNHSAHPYPTLGISVMALAFFHSMFDYADQFPAVAITFAAILGVAAAQSFGDTASSTTYSGDDRRQT